MKSILFSPLLCVLLIPTLVSCSAAQEPSYDQPWRPQYHFTPPRNFMTDPNETVFYKGEYHMGGDEIELHAQGGLVRKSCR